MFGPATSTLAATAQSPGSVFGGLTSQHWPVVFEVSGDGRALMAASAGLWMKCTSGDQFALNAGFARIPIAANGKFRSKWSQPPTVGSDGTTVSASETIHGALDHRHRWLSGVWRFQMTIALASGPTDRCDSGAVRFHAMQ
jgi:hypothetical protein